MPVYYYERDGKNRPMVTHCLIKLADNIGHGIAVCSIKDQPCKKIGRAIASGRALKCLQTEKNNYDSSAHLFKAEFQPDLTDFEKRLMERSHYANHRQT
jgi:hypothetical protein